VDSSCPINFEYQITVIKEHPDIRVGPLSGDIAALQTTCINIEYCPRSYTTAECEIQVRTTEFASEPKLIRIVGNAAPGKDQKVTRVNVAEVEQEPEDELHGTQTKTLLMNKRQKLESLHRKSKSS